MNIVRKLAALKQTIPLMRHGGVPLALKLGTAAVGIVIVSPLDLFSDVPVLGLFDDAALLSILAYGFVHVASRYAARAAPVRS
ncbi:MAG: DUF1232 domain-containing protein [bacterium]|nr:DUF1232 domain-containing protein [bacterium]